MNLTSINVSPKIVALLLFIHSMLGQWKQVSLLYLTPNTFFWIGNWYFVNYLKVQKKNFSNIFVKLLTFLRISLAEKIQGKNTRYLREASTSTPGLFFSFWYKDSESLGIEVGEACFYVIWKPALNVQYIINQKRQNALGTGLVHRISV